MTGSTPLDDLLFASTLSYCVGIGESTVGSLHKLDQSNSYKFVLHAWTAIRSYGTQPQRDHAYELQNFEPISQTVMGRRYMWHRRRICKGT
jgi:hypothetical protein